MQKTAPVLSVKGLIKSRAAGEAEAYTLRVPALEARPGDKILLTGPSGSGKSTLLDMLGMVLRPDGVEEFFYRPAKDQSLDVAAAWRAGATEKLALWRRSVGYVLQTGGLLPFLSVRENIRTQRRLLALPPDAEEVDRLIGELGIGHLLPKLPTALSVGERQRVAIARALAAGPALVLADEPTAALDPENAATVLALFARAVDERGATLIMVSHAPEQMSAMNFRRFTVRTARQEGGVLAVLQSMAASAPARAVAGGA